MLGERWGHYSYSFGQNRVQVSWGLLESEAIGFFTRRRDWSFSTQSTPHGQVLYFGGVPAGAESLEALVPAVDEHMAREERVPSLIVFPGLDSEEVAHESAHDVRTAAHTLIDLLKKEAETLAVLYGYVNPLMAAFSPEPEWGGEISGLRLLDDPHYYSLEAELGELTLTRYDAVSGQPLERIDIRSWDVLRTEYGEFKICRQRVDLAPLLRDLKCLIESLADLTAEVVAIQTAPAEGGLTA